MRRKAFSIRLAACAAGMLVLVACGGGLPPAANYGRISGVVTDAATGAPIVGAVVTVNSVLSSTPTGADGKYTLYPIPTGAFEYSATAPGYASLPTGQDTVDPGATKTINIQLSK